MSGLLSASEETMAIRVVVSTFIAMTVALGGVLVLAGLPTAPSVPPSTPSTVYENFTSWNNETVYANSTLVQNHTFYADSTVYYNSTRLEPVLWPVQIAGLAVASLVVYDPLSTGFPSDNSPFFLWSVLVSPNTGIVSACGGGGSSSASPRLMVEAPEIAGSYYLGVVLYLQVGGRF
jgi:hypothetical protein